MAIFLNNPWYFFYHGKLFFAIYHGKFIYIWPWQSNFGPMAKKNWTCKIGWTNHCKFVFVHHWKFIFWTFPCQICFMRLFCTPLLIYFLYTVCSAHVLGLVDTAHACVPMGTWYRILVRHRHHRTYVALANFHGRTANHASPVLWIFGRMMDPSCGCLSQHQQDGCMST